MVQTHEERNENELTEGLAKALADRLVRAGYSPFLVSQTGRTGGRD